MHVFFLTTFSQDALDETSRMRGGVIEGKCPEGIVKKMFS